MDNWTQLGVAGITLGILFFIVRYFVKALDAKDKVNIDLTNKFIKIAEENTEARIKLKQSIDANTNATKTTADNLTKLVLDVLKSK